jgi:hypothetical protein
MNLRCLTAPPGSLSSESCLALKPVTRKFGLNSGPSGGPRWVKSRHLAAQSPTNIGPTGIANPSLVDTPTRGSPYRRFSYVNRDAVCDGPLQTPDERMSLLRTFVAGPPPRKARPYGRPVHELFFS